MAHPNEELIRAGYQAFGAGDMDALAGLLDPTVVWHVPGRNPFAGDYEGHEAVFGYFGRIAQETAGSMSIDLHDAIANDVHGVGLIHVAAERGGRTIDERAVNVFHISDGKVTEAWYYPEDISAYDAFWA